MFKMHNLSEMLQIFSQSKQYLVEREALLKE